MVFNNGFLKGIKKSYNVAKRDESRCKNTIIFGFEKYY
jgi:hypothetical protein